MARIYVLGMAVMDFVFDVPAFPDQAQKYRATNAVLVGGGCAANGAYAVAKLGGDAVLAARFGDDQVADLILSDLTASGVDVTRCHKANGGQSSFSSVLVDATGERQIVNFRGSGLTEETSWIAPDADAVLVDNRWPAGAATALAWAKSKGVPGVVDAEAPVDQSSIQDASHVAFSMQGLSAFTGSNETEVGLKIAATKLDAQVCVTDGERGCFWLSDGAVAHVPAYPVNVRDTLAAGDIWHGAFALRLAEHADMVSAISFANATAALKCTVFGGRAGCPDRSRVEAFMRETDLCN